MTEKVKILVIDDESSIRETFKMTLKIKNYAVETFPDGPSALGRFKKDVYQVAFIDLVLPTMDGLEVLRQIKIQDPKIAVIIMTAYATDVSEANALHLGALEYLRKPFLMEEIYELIERGLQYRGRDKSGQ